MSFGSLPMASFLIVFADGFLLASGSTDERILVGRRGYLQRSGRFVHPFRGWNTRYFDELGLAAWSIIVIHHRDVLVIVGENN